MATAIKTEAMQATGNTAVQQAMDNLTAQWYNTITAGLNLDRQSFQLAQGYQSLNTDSNEALWNAMDAIPPKAVNHYFDPSQFNNFSQDYGAVINSLVRTTSNKFTPCMGGNDSTSYKAWQSYLANLKPFPSVSELPTAFNQWAAIYSPGNVGCAGAYAQLLNDPLNLNLQNYVAASNQGKGPFAYNVTIEEVNKLLRTQYTSMELDSKTTATSVKDTWAQTTHKVFFGLFSASASYASESVKAYSAGIQVKVTLNKILTQPIGPLAKSDPDDNTLKNYVPWFNSAVLDRAYKNSGSNVWDAAGFTNWDDNFSDTGKMQRAASALVIIDDFTISITSDASFSSDEQSRLQAGVSGGVWPFYRGSASGGSSTHITFNDKGQMTMTTVSPAGQPAILGILQTPIADYLT